MQKKKKTKKKKTIKKTLHTFLETDWLELVMKILEFCEGYFFDYVDIYKFPKFWLSWIDSKDISNYLIIPSSNIKNLTRHIVKLIIFETKHWFQKWDCFYKIYIYSISPPQVGCDTRSIFKWSTAGLNSISFLLDGSLTSMSSYLPKAGSGGDLVGSSLS